MGTLKEELERWKSSRYRKPMSVALAEVREGHDCKKVHPGKRHQEWIGEEMLDEGRMKDIYTMDQEGKSHKDIAKRLKLKVSTVKTILGEEVETLHEFSASQIASLKKDYEPMRGKTISGQNALKLMRIFDKFEKNKELLIKLLTADIPFVSMLAQARLVSRHGANASQLARMRKNKGSGDMHSLFNQEHEPKGEELTEAKSPFRLSYDDKYGKHAGFEDAKTLQDLQNKAQKLRSKGFKIDKMGRNTSPVEQKLPEPEGKQIATEAKYHYDIKISSDYGNDGGDQEDEGTLNASNDKDAQKQADKLADKFAELWNKRKRSVGRPGGFDPVEIDVYKEAYTVQITKTDGSKLVIGKYNTPAEAEKYIKWYKTGDMSKTKSAKVIKEDSGYLQSKMSDKQIANIKNVWKNKKATDVTDAVRQMIKRMDIPTQLAIKSADIPHISKLVETDDKAYAIGMAKAKEIKKDSGTPLKKSTVEKGHEIAKAIKKDEQVVGVGPRATFERLWLKHKRGDKAGK